MEKIAAYIHGYTYGMPDVVASKISLQELDDLKTSAGLNAETFRYLRLAGEVLADQTKPLVDLWRTQIIASIPNLARHSRTPDGEAIPEYLASSGLRFQQWILDTCLRPYDQDWINYQEEIARRHTSAMKNQIDGIRSTAYVPLRDIIAFIAVMNETIKPFLAAKGNSPEEIAQMHQAWRQSMQLQIAIWTKVYVDYAPERNEW